MLSRAADRRIRVAVVEDEPLFRSLLVRALELDPRFEVVGDWSDGPSALNAAAEARPEVVTLDIELPGRVDGIQLGFALRQQLPGLGIVLLSNHDDPRFVGAVAEDANAGWSYLLKRSVRDVEALGRAVAGAAAGEVVVDPQLLVGLKPRRGGQLERLTSRQREILALLAQGLTNATIAERLVLAEKSVENQLTAIYSELGIDRRASAAHPRVSAVLIYLRESRRGRTP
jgi:DNA-binding NarL/FixJ family response regulator